MTTSPPPTFVLSGPAGTLWAEGAGTCFSDVDAARSALAGGQTPIVVGALPFRPGAAAALFVPGEVRRTDTLPPLPGPMLPAVRIVAQLPEPDTHRARIRRALDQLSAPQGVLHKVVLARGLRLSSDAPLDAGGVLRRLVAADPSGYGYLSDLSAAGGEFNGAVLVGASPELLVARDGDRVTCRPFAGSAPRSPDASVDAANGAALAESGKNRHEHQLVVDQLRAALGPLCTDLDVAPSPRLTGTAAVWHLSTPISGRLRDTSTTALDLALALHPTAAVGGVPTAAAVDLITELEGDRGFYAGAVGWCDAAGDGRWVVSIRCAQLSADRRTALAHAGGGIVAESDPDDELAETVTKFSTILTALGAQPPSAAPAG
ncbi:isochorismate synthase [[Mycobacterium] crassicus]|uniref:isochorismate synthase n=1 Tax=[Mycobacterium] crassicus TaxID=2872309 RepID=A0ABU5XK49_9MYCO|nr:isochorismate synthase [Mycolicibacter sp. MYC098]MEB3022641.1 isochorismate synthase [Mycolicibacter sp. MYC098]